MTTRSLTMTSLEAAKIDWDTNDPLAVAREAERRLLAKLREMADDWQEQAIVDEGAGTRVCDGAALAYRRCVADVEELFEE